MTRTAAAVALLLALLPRSGAAQSGPDPALDVLERASARYSRMSGLCADFRQVIEVRLLGETRASQGRMCQQPPNLFSMDFSEPEGDRVVADGEYLWLYYPSTDDRQVFRSRLDEGSGGLDFYREFLADPGVKYAATHRGTETREGVELEKIDIVPNGPASYNRATVWIAGDTGLIHRIVLEEENGSVRTVDLAGIQVDPAMDPAVFSFTPPAGANVLSR